MPSALKCQGDHGRRRANYRCCLPALAGFVSPHSMGPGAGNVPHESAGFKDKHRTVGCGPSDPWTLDLRVSGVLESRRVAARVACRKAGRKAGRQRPRLLDMMTPNPTGGAGEKATISLPFLYRSSIERTPPCRGICNTGAFPGTSRYLPCAPSCPIAGPPHVCR